MKPWLISLALAFFAVTARADLPTTKPVFVGTSTWTGAQLLKLSKSDREMYCLGLLHGLLASPLLGTNEEAIRRVVDRLKGDTTIEQFEAIVSKYIREHPERWHEPANLLATFAFKAAFIDAAKRGKD